MQFFEYPNSKMDSDTEPIFGYPTTRAVVGQIPDPAPIKTHMILMRLSVCFQVLSALDILQPPHIDFFQEMYPFSFTHPESITK